MHKLSVGVDGCCKKKVFVQQYNRFNSKLKVASLAVNSNLHLAIVTTTHSVDQSFLDSIESSLGKEAAASNRRRLFLIKPHNFHSELASLLHQHLYLPLHILFDSETELAAFRASNSSLASTTSAVFENCQYANRMLRVEPCAYLDLKFKLDSDFMLDNNFVNADLLVYNFEQFAQDLVRKLTVKIYLFSISLVTRSIVLRYLHWFFFNKDRKD